MMRSTQDWWRCQTCPSSEQKKTNKPFSPDGLSLNMPVVDLNLHGILVVVKNLAPNVSDSVSKLRLTFTVTNLPPGGLWHAAVGPGASCQRSRRYLRINDHGWWMYVDICGCDVDVICSNLIGFKCKWNSHPGSAGNDLELQITLHMASGDV